MILKVDLNKNPSDQPVPLHNRWHPLIPPIASVKPGDSFRVECLDCYGGQIGNNDSVDDLLNADSSGVHFLSGPIAVEGAEPGDLLTVDILDIGPLAGREWGFTCKDKNGDGDLYEWGFTSQDKNGDLRVRN